MHAKVTTAVLVCLVTLAATAAAGGPRVIRTSKAHTYKTATCATGAGKCPVVRGRDITSFSLASKTRPASRSVHGFIYGGVCGAKNVVERIVRIEERRRAKYVDLLVVLEKNPPADPSKPPMACPAIARAFPFTAVLSHGLGNRMIRDASTVPAHPVTTAPPY